MMRLATAAAVLAALACAASAATPQDLDVTDDGSQGRKDKKADQMVNDMYTAFMMTKNVMSMMLMFVSPIIQIKGFGLSVINTLINIGRFVLQMQANKRLQDMPQVQHVGSMYPQQMYAMRHIDQHKEQHEASEDQHKNRGENPVYIVKDADSWSGGSLDDSWSVAEHTKDHEEVISPWTTEDHSSAPSHQWPPSQKFEYYASPPALHYSSRQGSPSLPQESLLSARASHVSRGHQWVYPYFSSNHTRVT